jgi:hypothetical protein
MWLDPIHDPLYVKNLLSAALEAFGKDGYGQKGATTYPARYYDLLGGGGEEQAVVDDDDDDDAEEEGGKGVGKGDLLHSKEKSATSSSNGSSAAPEISMPGPASSVSSSAAATLLPSSSSSELPRYMPRSPADGGSNDVKTVAASRRRLIGMLRAANQELNDVPLYYDIASLANRVHTNSLSAPQFIYALEHAGYRTSFSHAAPHLIKTDAPPSAVWDLVRCWVAQPKYAVAEKHLSNPGSLASAILSKKAKQIFSFPPTPEAAKLLATEAKRRLGGPLHLPIPAAEWGPGSRASAAKAASVADGSGASNVAKLPQVTRDLWTASLKGGGEKST